MLHAWLDELTLTLSIVAEHRRGFARTPLVAPPDQPALLAELRARPVELSWSAFARRRTRVPVALPTLAAESFLDFVPGPSAQPDTLIVYHHGLGELVHDALPRALFAASPELRARCDLVALKAVHHDHPLGPNDMIACRDRFIRCIAASAAVAREVAKARRADYAHLVLCGVSLGGVVSLVEASHEPRFDLYVPFVAGPDLHDVALESSFSRLVQAGWRRRARRAPWAADLNALTGILAREPGPPIHALLARSDRLFRLGPQRAAYAAIPRARVRECAGGHITGAVAVRELVTHLGTALASERWAAASRQVA